ncbi:MAG: bifunctional riboflavin kinase/FAD synthetase [Clostridium sp.]|nr:bifunctional riboflavin kinase/FAD synthetase [Clostridium sp.]
MEIIQDTTEFMLESKSAVAIGKFDGVHKGHARLLSHILEQKEKGMRAVVFTFHPSATVFFGKKNLAKTISEEITTRWEKRKLFEKMGVDILIEFPLNEQTAATPPEEFVKKYLTEQMRTAYLAAGADISFGYKGRGNQELLLKMAPDCGYQVRIIEKLYHGDREISSTYVREEVEKGDMVMAKELLGRYYSFDGRVEEGSRLGRKLGMPTLNLYPEKKKLLPPKGVYYSKVILEDKTYCGITNIGRKPTVNDTDAVDVETYLYDFNRNVYGKEIVTELLQFKRPEHRFADVTELKAQMEKDIAEGRAFHGL